MLFAPNASGGRGQFHCTLFPADLQEFSQYLPQKKSPSRPSGQDGLGKRSFQSVENFKKGFQILFPTLRF
jgi:hypothetical protein